MNNKEIKLVALDMDGTLLNDRDEVSLANRETIREAQSKGIHIVCCTGRSLITSRDYVKNLELSSYHITVNGSEVWDEKGVLIHRKIVPTDHIQWMFDLAKEHQTKFWATATDRVWRREMPEEIENHTWLKFGFEIPEDDVRNTILGNLRERGQYFEISNSSPINIEVNSSGVNKARGIEVVCGRLGLSMDQVMAVGDSLNDMSMIQAAGIGVAMGNAQEEVKRAANWVTATNNEDGVAHAIHKWVLS
ncbi:Cof-type HAD-IIB family hydrolase [Bacillus sp. 1NLA3E]|uniref:Cof-type HAD-IIB family hydrolase n=1 Tax=Bacillus sp. 1NLA3E TaxID=666686 RepID=UPI000247EABB|nr:Cof-type HAD-IIB family hydrolase [Bacillus sp. 1NLA3E]AGK53386.1 hydrolase YcsE [Bacillus sp. 1NLA3E]